MFIKKKKIGFKRWGTSFVGGYLSCTLWSSSQKIINSSMLLIDHGLRKLKSFDMNDPCPDTPAVDVGSNFGDQSMRTSEAEDGFFSSELFFFRCKCVSNRKWGIDLGSMQSGVLL